MKIATQIDRYLARLILVPLVGTLCLAAMLLLLDRMLRLFDFVVSEGRAGRGRVADARQSHPRISRARHSGRADARRAARLPQARFVLGARYAARGRAWLRPAAARALRLCLLLLGFNFAIVGFVQPYAQYAYQSLRFELSSGALGASIKVGEFTNLGRRMTLRVERSERGGTDLHGVFLRMEQKNGRTLAVTADRGTFLATDDPDTILLRLANGRLVHDAPGYRIPRVLRFVQHDLPINLPAIANFRCARQRHQGADFARARPHRPRPQCCPSSGAMRRAPISISAWSRSR